MALLQYFQPTISLSMAKETTLSDTVTQSVNVSVQCEAKQKHEAYTTLTTEQRATIGRYATSTVIWL